MNVLKNIKYTISADDGRNESVVVLFPLSFSHPTVWIYYFALSVKHRLSETSFINLTVFPPELSRPVYFISLEISLQNTIFSLNRSLSLPFAILKLTIVLYPTFGFNSSEFIVHETSAKFTHVLATAVIPSVSAGTLLKT